MPVVASQVTGSLAPLALRFALSAIHECSPNTVEQDLRGALYAYAWSESTEGPGVFFEDLITTDSGLSDEQRESLIRFARRATAWGGADSPAAKSTFGQRLRGLQRFLDWVLLPTNHGGVSVQSDGDRLSWLKMFGILIRQATSGLDAPAPSERSDPLTPDDVAQIRKVIARREDGSAPAVFSATTWLRNWALFEVLLSYGMREGEVASWSLDDLPPTVPGQLPSFDITISRQTLAKGDPRGSNAPRGKTVSRHDVPPLWPAALAVLRSYLATRRPDSRPPTPSHRYVFVNEDGTPMSTRNVRAIIRRVGEAAAAAAADDASIDANAKRGMLARLQSLHPHVLRHTWSELMALRQYNAKGEAGFDDLQRWGGWRSTKSMDHYIQFARAFARRRSVEQYLRAYADSTVSPPKARTHGE